MGTIEKRKCQCGKVAEQGIYCDPCDAVVIIAMYIKGFVLPERMNDMLSDWYKSGIMTSDRLLQVATERDASEMKKLAHKIKLQEGKAKGFYNHENKSVMQRAMDYCWRAKGEGTSKDVVDAMQTAMEGIE